MALSNSVTEAGVPKKHRKSVFSKIYAVWLQLKVRKLGRKLGFSIPANVFGPGLSIAHAGTIVNNKNVKKVLTIEYMFAQISEVACPKRGTHL